METTFRSDERQAAQTSILDEANVAGDLTLENRSEKCMITITSHSSDILEYDINSQFDNILVSVHIQGDDRPLPSKRLLTTIKCAVACVCVGYL